MKTAIVDRQKIFFVVFLLLLLSTLNFNSLALSQDITLDREENIALVSDKIIARGQEILINGNKYPVAWIQWQEGDYTCIGISDIAAMLILGLELLNTNNPNLQPTIWFGERFNLNAKFINPYRYLDITELATRHWQLEVINNNLNLNLPTAQIINIVQMQQNSGEQITVELESSVAWRLSQNGKEAVITIDSAIDSSLSERFQTPITQTEEIKKDEDDLGGTSTEESLSELSIESTLQQTKLKIKHPPGSGVKVSTTTNGLLIDIRPDYLLSKKISWSSGIIWNQQYISLENETGLELFPVVWLEIDLKDPRISIQPIATNNDRAEGIAPLLQTARLGRAVAAINAGFFNRNNQFPLGGIRRDRLWRSGPILNRGAIAWNDKGKIKIGRLALQETAILSNGERVALGLLNSAYVQPGIARYTKAWGQTYTTLADNETIFVVENNTIVEQLEGGIAGQNSFNIPTNDYLLVVRGEELSREKLSLGTDLRIESKTVPDDFNNYPNLVGAGPLLLEKGEIVLDPTLEKFSVAFGKQNASRSAIATLNNGKLILLAVHNRPNGKGPNLQELAMILKRLGAVDALNLDGGSSTSLYLGGQLLDRSPVTAARVQNAIGIFVKD
jgi:hypothetical protein